MSVITISRGSYRKGREIAEKVTEKLGYKCISRDAILEASKEFNVPEIKLIRAIHDAPSILDRIGYRKEKYIAFIQSALLRHFREDNVVYCGLAGHFFVKDIPHVLKVRILADLDERVKAEAETQGISRNEALRIIRQDDEERRKWSRHLYGIDTNDPSLYDIVIHVGKITVDDATNIICKAVSLDRFKTTPESQRAIENLCIAAEVKAALMEVKPDVDVVSESGIVHVYTSALLSEGESLIKDIETIARSVDGVKEVKVRVKPKDIAQ